MAKQKGFVRHRAAFIDPANVGSNLRWVVKGSAYEAHDYLRGTPPKTKGFKPLVNGDMTLGDCSRVISWDFNQYGDHSASSLKKIDNVIAEFQRFRKALVEAVVYAKKETGRENAKLQARVSKLSKKVEGRKAGKRSSAEVVPRL
jgi:hypothetical protein